MKIKDSLAYSGVILLIAVLFFGIWTLLGGEEVDPREAKGSIANEALEGVL